MQRFAVLILMRCLGGESQEMGWPGHRAVSALPPKLLTPTAHSKAGFHFAFTGGVGESLKPEAAKRGVGG